MLTPGTLLGGYEIRSLLGAGGMGEVYRAFDPRLDREVAIKVLPDHIAANDVPLARFRREAKAVASLSHPNIVAVYEFGSDVDTPFVVMEFLTGQTLAEVLRRGPLPVRQAVDHAVQIARGLAAAHDKGVVHRDLKPANVFLVSDGQVKILDFGLARSFEPPSGSTETMPALSDPGMVLGTVGYMAPEQVRGLSIDVRADLFALGAVLYEMLSGQRAFRSETAAETMAAIIREDPVNLATLRADVPEALDRIVRHCLEKQPSQRFQSARDVAFALETLSGSGSHASGAVAAADRPASRPMVLEATFPTSLLIDPDEHIPPNVEVSPDGRYLVFVARPTGRANCLWLRPLDRTIAEPLEGTVGARFPFWSPDGRHVAFFAGQKLKRIAIPEGHIQSICDAESGRGGTWNRDGVIIFGNVFSPLYQVHAAGGVPVPLTTLDERAGELGHRWPSFLPDGRHFVYFVYLTPESADANGGTFLGALGSDARRKIVTKGSNCRIQQSGHLFFFRDGHVMAQPFDLTRHEPAGEAQIVAEHCAYDREKHFASFSTAESLIAWSPPVTSRLSQLRWVDRNGRPCGDVGEPGILRGFRLSPDGTQVAKSLMDVRTRAQCLWLHDVASNVQTRLTTDPLRQDDLPVWSPAGDMLAFSAISPRGSASLWRIRLDGSAPEQFHASKHGEYVSDWSPDGQWIAVSKYSPATDSIAAWLYPSGGQDEPSLLFQTAFQILSVQFSPDNRWIAYVSTESGAPEVYVTVFPGPGMKRRVSSRGGTRPRWRADGRELYFISAAGELMAVDVKLDGSLRTGAPQLLFAIDLETQYLEEHHNHYDVSADGQKFLVQSIIGDRRPTSFNIGLNWL